MVMAYEGGMTLMYVALPRTPIERVGRERGREGGRIATSLGHPPPSMVEPLYTVRKIHLFILPREEKLFIIYVQRWQQ